MKRSFFFLLLAISVGLSIVAFPHAQALAQTPTYNEYVAGVDVDPVPKQDIMSLVKYPQEAIERHLEGKTVVRGLLDTNGRVKKVVIDASSGSKLLDDAARDAMLRASFAPALSGGKPVKVWYQTAFNFKLPKAQTHLDPAQEGDPDLNDFMEVDEEPVAITSIQSLVQYPTEAIANKWEGKVFVRALIRPDGRVHKVVVDKSSGHQLLDDAAVAAVNKAEFTPAKVKGKPVTVWLLLPIGFRLR